jgi:hypothetical protein
MRPVFIIITTDRFILNNNFLLFMPNQFQHSKEQGKVSISFLFQGLFLHSENGSGFNKIGKQFSGCPVDKREPESAGFRTNGTRARS